MDTPRTFRRWLKHLRAEQDIKQELLAEMVGCSVDTIRAFESGRRRPSRAMAERLAAMLQVGADQCAEFVRMARTSPVGEPSAGLATDSGAEVTRPPLPARLPLPPTSFIGRAVEAVDVRRRLNQPSCRLLTILGPGGAGKTRLALQVAVEEQAAVPHAVAFVQLAQVTTADQAAGAIATTLGCPLLATATVEESLLVFLHNRDLLLVLDNLEHVLHVTALLAAVLREAPGVQLLVTSRERLRVHGEQVFELRGLATPPDDSRAAIDQSDAVLLFLERARHSLPDFALTPHNRAAVAAICRLVDGMPLGIELAAAWVRALSPDEIAAEIARGLDFLALSDRDVDARHRSMRAVIDHSWVLLGPQEQRVLAQLAICRGGCTREAAEVVAGATLPVLAGLLDKSLLRRSASGRYEMHELVRQYVAERLAEDPSALARTRAQHCAYYSRWLTGRSSQVVSAQQDTVAAEIAVEIDNIRAAWQYGVEQRDIGVLQQMADGGMLWFYELRGWYHEAEQACQCAVEALRSPSPATRAQAQLLGNLTGMQGWFTFRRGQPEVGMALLEESIRLLRPGDHPQWLFNSLVQLAHLALFRGEYERAEALVAEHATLADHLDTPWSRAHVLVQQGALHVERAPERAYVHLQESMAHLRAVGDQHLLVMGLNYLGDAALNLGRTGEAEQAYTEARAVNANLHNGIMDVWALAGLAAVARAREAHAGAITHALEAVVRSREVGEIWSQARALAALGETERDGGDHLAARHTFIEAMRLCLRAGLMPIAAHCWLGLAGLDLPDLDRHRDLAVILAVVQTHPAVGVCTARCAAHLWAALAAEMDAHALTEVEGVAARIEAGRLPSLLAAYIEDKPSRPPQQS
jgi:predicted ATPase/transcriptional regulator with XRE-family HTH domain